MRSVDVHIPVVILYYSFIKYYYWGKQSKGYTKSLSIISCNCMWTYNYFKKFSIYKNYFIYSKKVILNLNIMTITKLVLLFVVGNVLLTE